MVQTVDDRRLAEISALMDGELDVQDVELEYLVSRQDWALYHVIGDVLREPAVFQSVSQEFSVRMTAALEREPSHNTVASLQPSAPDRPRSSWWQRVSNVWPGMAVAAAVVSVIWVAEPLLGSGTLQSQAGSRGAAMTETPTALIAEATPALDYASAHRQLSGPIAVRDVSFSAGGNQ